jgi:hypothetical protein
MEYNKTEIGITYSALKYPSKIWSTCPRAVTQSLSRESNSPCGNLSSTFRKQLDKILISTTY